MDAVSEVIHALHICGAFRTHLNSERRNNTTKVWSLSMIVLRKHSSVIEMSYQYAEESDEIAQRARLLFNVHFVFDFTR